MDQHELEILENVRWYLMEQYSHLQEYIEYLHKENLRKPCGTTRMEFNKFRNIQQYLEWLITDVENKIED
jgi:hypothetical protein